MLLKEESHNMRILHINTFDHAGGAARAAYWLHSGLRKKNIDSMMLVQHKTDGERAIVSKPGRMEILLKDIRWIFDGLPLLFYPKREVTHWSTGCVPHRLKKFIKEINPDIIHLHWICRGHTSIAEIGRICSLGCPVVWTLHDSWAFTGGCHVPGDCKQYQTGCGQCPQLSSHRSNDLSSLTLGYKKKKWKKSNLVLTAPSKWLAECTKQSLLFANSHIVTIPNGIDTDVFSPVDKELARSVLRLSDSNKTKILCGAINAYGDPNKGFHLLQQAINSLVQDGWQEKIELIIFGESESPATQTLPVDTHYLGVLHDNETLRLAYSAADLFVIPSLQENLPNSILESLACNTPVVAFNAGGIPDIIHHGENGYLAIPYDAVDLANCIKQASTFTHEVILNERFIQESSVNKYLSLYKDLIKKH